MMQNQQVDSTTVIKWVNDWGPLITLLATVLLTAVTASLVYVTKTMAASAQTSAEQCRLAAEASLSSVAAAEASIDVQFDVNPVRVSTVGQMEGMIHGLGSPGLHRRDTELTSELMRAITVWQEVALTCRGATVSLHGLQLTFIGVQDPLRPDSKLRRVISGVSYDPGIELTPTERLPRVCHTGNTVRFEVKDRPVGERLAEFHASVSYAFGNGPIRTQEVPWREPRDPTA
jgi:hypothetical protein